VAVGVTVTATLAMRGSGGLVALASRLTWDPAVVEPVSSAAGKWLTEQGGQAFSPAPGAVDAAVFGAGGLTGQGDLATVTFRVLSAGDPKIRIASLDGRDAMNRKVTVASSLTPLAAAVPAVTRLGLAQPNPFRATATIAFSLAQPGNVDLTLFSVDGRRVRTLARGVREPGEYTEVWDGRDEAGQTVAAGVYYALLQTPQGRFTRTVTYLK